MVVTVVTNADGSFQRQRRPVRPRARQPDRHRHRRRPERQQHERQRYCRQAQRPAAASTADTVAAAEDTPVTISPSTLLANDGDADNDGLTITSVQGAVNGSVAIVGGNVVFTPSPNYSGPASFTYTVSDGQGGSATSTVNVTVGAVNDVPVSSTDTVAASEDTPTDHHACHADRQRR
ncbi:cadherin-like domain-containing protein [Massilia sp. B-10]|nr:cadherin-like domain-containing protein [Massilia sp. B-10]